MKQTPPSGNCKSMESSVDHLGSTSSERVVVDTSRGTYPKVDTISGPNPDTAPLTVYLRESADAMSKKRTAYAAAIMSATSQILTSNAASRIWDPLSF